MELTNHDAWTATDYELHTDLGMYWISRLGSEWTANHRAKGAREGERMTSIDALDAQGNAVDWPTVGTAKLACQAHYERMRRNGETPAEASAKIAVNTDVLGAGR